MIYCPLYGYVTQETIAYVWKTWLVFQFLLLSMFHTFRRMIKRKVSRERVSSWPSSHNGAVKGVCSIRNTFPTAGCTTVRPRKMNPTFEYYIADLLHLHQNNVNTRLIRVIRWSLATCTKVIFNGTKHWDKNKSIILTRLLPTT